MVAVATSEVGEARVLDADGRPTARWTVAAGAAVLLGVAVRLALGGGGAGDRAAAVMTVLLGLSAFAAAWLLSTPRSAFVVTLALMALLDLAALPAWQATEYDDRQALYRTDQTIAAQVAPVTNRATDSLLLTLVVEPVLSGSQAPFGLAGELGEMSLTWDCPFQRGLQRLALPLPTDPGAAEVRLHLTGSPRREGDYLLVYTSSVQRGALLALSSANNLDQAPPATLCTLR